VRIKVNTYFDITETYVNRPYKGQNLPAKVRNIQINSVDEWNLKRKQQGNLETVQQVLSMRGTLVNVSTVVKNNDIWSFTFDIDDTLVYGENLCLLKEELIGVPMVTGLTEGKMLDQFLTNDNIWFETDV
jgi:hypothetical protein